jgi:GH25 family lysozyme M1 (1,4-beta-N-acetylmuramidase)
MAAVPGIDVSSNQGVIDWAQVAAFGQKYAFIRSTMGRAGVDKRFTTNYRRAKDAGLLVGIYHLVRPEWRGTEQMEHFLTVIDGLKADFPLVLDVELDGSDVGQPKTNAEIAACVRECADVLRMRGQRSPLIYTGAWFWNKKIPPSSEWGAFDLWIAHYGATSPRLPIGWTDWVFWQYTDKGKVPGVVTDCDLNWFDGTMADLLQYAAGVMLPKPNALRLRVTASAINVRNAPSISARDIGDLNRGAELEIRNLGGSHVWVEFKPGQWAAYSITAGKFMDWAAGTPPQVRVTASLINVRSGPDVKYDDIGDLRSADLLDVLSIDGQDVWVEFEPGQWAAFAVNGRRFMEIVKA